jgi:IS605 OrfB family transposase
MAGSKKQQKTEEVYTPVIPVVSCADETQVDRIAELCRIPRALTYNKLGSLKGWGLDGQKADPIVRTILKATDINLPSKLCEWSISDTMKAIAAQQEAAKIYVVREIGRKYSLSPVEKERTNWLKTAKSTKNDALLKFPKAEAEILRDNLFDLLLDDPTANPWLHSIFRKQYQRGHTFVKNQIVERGGGYSGKRLTRNTVTLEVAGFSKGKRIALKLKCRYVSGQMRLIRNQRGGLETHCVSQRLLTVPTEKIAKEIGVAQGYTEGFYTSDGDEMTAGLGKLMTAKSKRIVSTDRNRYRLRSYIKDLDDPIKVKNILENNLGHNVKSRKLQRDRATIQNLIRRDLKKLITSPTRIFAEDLTQPITGKQQSKAINRQLNQWMKGELQASWEKISRETGSTLSVVNPAYTSQMCSQTGTLLGKRDGDVFTAYTGVVIQSDKNATLNILYRGSDSEINRWMKDAEVRKVLLLPTVRYLTSIGKSVTEAWDLGWLNPKFKAEVLRLEDEYHRQG